MELIDLLPASYIKQIAEDLGTSVLLALARKKKIVSGKTAQSIYNKVLAKTANLLEVGSFGGEGMEYIVEGKKANTKLPLRKVGNRFELVPALKDWKSLVNFEGSDYILARAIAKNKRLGVDIPGEAASIFQERYASDIQTELFDLVIEQFKKENDIK